MLIIKEINFNYYKKEILKLRKSVWQQNNLYPLPKVLDTCFYDEFDDNAYHWVAFDKNNNTAASARLSKHLNLNSLSGHQLTDDSDIAGIEFPIASSSRLVIHKSFHGYGLEERFDNERITKAKQLECKSVCIITYGQRTKKNYG